MSKHFDPNAAAAPDSGIFGLSSNLDEAAVHVLPVSFDATASYRKGAWKGPDAVFRASKQVDLFDLATGRPYEAG
ncbi:MAG: arginase family protein, partial [Planctomycetes bacterium]|nr:arginase family protein [Planctomycetota bacterium]